MRGGNLTILPGSARPTLVISMLLVSLVMAIALAPAAHAIGLIYTTTCPNQAGGVIMPPGATFTDEYGNTWVAPSGSEGGGGGFSTFGPMTSFFFAGPFNSIPAPMLQGYAGIYGTYSGQQGWIITDYCLTTLLPV